MEQVNEIVNQVFGTLSFVTVVVGFIFAGMGMLLSLLIESTTRKVHDPKSPVEFSWEYMLKDNAKRLLIACLLTFILMRFSTEILGEGATLYVGVICGFATDLMAMGLKKMIRNYVKSKTESKEDK